MRPCCHSPWVRSPRSASRLISRTCSRCCAAIAVTLGLRIDRFPDRLCQERAQHGDREHDDGVGLVDQAVAGDNTDERARRQHRCQGRAPPRTTPGTSVRIGQRSHAAWTGGHRPSVTWCEKGAHGYTGNSAELERTRRRITPGFTRPSSRMFTPTVAIHCDIHSIPRRWFELKPEKSPSIARLFFRHTHC